MKSCWCCSDQVLYSLDSDFGMVKEGRRNEGTARYTKGNTVHRYVKYD